jgi:hypothetical protein
LNHYAIVEFDNLEEAEKYVKDELNDYQNENILIVQEIYRKYPNLM